MSRRVSLEGSQPARDSDPPPSRWNVSSGVYCDIRESDAGKLPIHKKPGLPKGALAIRGAFRKVSQEFVGDIEGLTGVCMSIFANG